METRKLPPQRPVAVAELRPSDTLRPRHTLRPASFGGSAGGMFSPGTRLPLLPGYTFRDVSRSAFHRSQTLAYKGGSPVARPPSVGVGQAPLESRVVNQQESSDLSIMAAELIRDCYSRRRGRLSDFVPSYVAYDKKVLRFFAYFTEEVQYSPNEEYRVRPVNIYYYLEDDSMELFEPEVENSGLLQGKRIKRHRVPKNDFGDHYHWKDLNVAKDLLLYGVKYRVIQCDAFTREFLESEGLIVNDPEVLPEDPYISSRQAPQHTHQSPSDFDSLHQFLTMDRQVLRFFALWEDPDSPDKTKKIHVTIMYYLVDNTVEIREVHEANSGRDPFPILMRRRKLPKQFKSSYESFPSCVLEVSPKEVDQYLSPKDLQVGKTVKLLDRRFLLYDCDVFTRSYFQTHHPDVDMQPLELQKEEDKTRDRKRDIPPYNGFGSLEDSQQNCLYLIPKPPKKNMIKLLENDNKVLRYSAIMESQDPRERHFILSYHLADDMISIFERPTANSGIIGGKFLKKTRVPKPGSTVENPEFYSPADFAIGSTVAVFSYRFVLTDADHFVLKYLESISEQIPTQTLDSVRQRLGVVTSTDQAGDPEAGDGEVAEAPLDLTENE